jgi:DNA-binding MarR family transcriptional regulator
MGNKSTTVPNQHVYVIHREKTKGSFIQIDKENFSKAYRDMSKSSAALGLYIWLVGNKDNFSFAFSPQAIENQLGMARSSCHGAVKKLEELGYLQQRPNSNIYDFYEVTTKNTNRKIIDSEMINFEESTAPSEIVEEKSDDVTAPTGIIKARPGNFVF